MKNTQIAYSRKLRWAVPILLAVLFSLSDTVAVNDGRLTGGATLLIKIAFFSSLFLALFFFIDKALFSLSQQENRRLPRCLSPVIAFLFCENGTISTLRIQAVIFACWIPWIIALQPGIFWSDTSQQLLEHYGLATLSDHHPYTTTLILGMFADIGETLFGSVSQGLFVLVILQCLVATFYFARFASKIFSLSARPLPSLGVTVFVSLFPFIPFMFCSLAKDTISAAFFVGVCFNIFAILNSEENEKLGFCKLLELTIVSLGCALTKKTAGFIVVISLLFLVVLFLRNKAKRPLVVPLAITLIVVFLIFPRVVLPGAGVLSGGKQEMIATAIQQVAHDVKYSESQLSDNDRRLIAEFLVINYEDIPDSYNWQIVDPIKQRSLRNEALLGNFLQLWARQSVVDPAGHLEAWLGLVSGWTSFRTDASCSPNYMVVLSHSGWYDEGIQDVTDWNDQLTKGGKIAENIYETVQSTPLLNMLFLRATWATVIPFFALFYLMGRDKNYRGKGFVLLAPLLLSMLTLAIVPVSIFGGEPTRYVFAMVCVSPFLLLCIDPTCRGIARLEPSREATKGDSLCHSESKAEMAKAN